MSFHSVSRGTPAKPYPGGQPKFSHLATSNDSAMRRGWQRFRDNCPTWLSRRLPYWPLRTMFQSTEFGADFELRLLREGSQIPPKWHFGIADDDGWETQFKEIRYRKSYPSTTPGERPEPDQIWFSGPLPRHSRLLRIRFHPWQDHDWEKSDAPVADADKWNAIGELIIPNPCYEGPAPTSSVTAEPVTKATRFGDVTLTRVERPRHVSDSFSERENALMAFEVKKGGKPVQLDMSCRRITDRSGQWFPIPGWGGGEENGQHFFWLPVAPWSDDPVWKITMEFQRLDRCSDVEESELFRFEHLPVPQGNLTEVNRTITRNGVTIRICDIELTEYNDWRLGIEHEVAGRKMDRSRRVIIQDVRDDQGRTRRTEKNDKTEIVHGPVGGTKRGDGYSIKLAPDARWWNLTLILEAPETVEFEFRPEFIK